MADKVKLKLTPDPTFRKEVPIPVPGGTPVLVLFTFKFRDREALADWAKSLGDKTDAQMVMEVASGWDLDDPFDEANVKRFTDSYLEAGAAVVGVYCRESGAARLGNLLSSRAG